jgi:hypothetical protein
MEINKNFLRFSNKSIKKYLSLQSCTKTYKSLGLSYEISNFVIDARYNLGLTKIADHFDGKNSVIMLTFGYMIPF